MNTLMVASRTQGIAYNEAEAVAAYEGVRRSGIAVSIVMLVLGAFVAVSPTAQAAGPVGNWNCTMDDGVPLGRLSLTTTSYTFEAELGRAAINGDAVRFVDGPLARMGIGFASYSLRDDPSPTTLGGVSEIGGRLVLRFGLGQTTVCVSASQASPL